MDQDNLKQKSVHGTFSGTGIPSCSPMFRVRQLKKDAIFYNAFSVFKAFKRVLHEKKG